MTNGLSDWPTKMFAAAPSDSTRVTPVTMRIAPPTHLMISCMIPR